MPKQTAAKQEPAQQLKAQPESELAAFDQYSEDAGPSDNALQHSDYLRSFWVSARAGAVFGIVIAGFFLNIATIPWPPVPFIVATSLGAALFSGLAGLSGAYLDVILERHGVTNKAQRGVITFGVVALMTVAITYLGGMVTNAFTDSDFRRLALGGAAAGVGFGAIFAFATFRAEMTRQKMLLLEMQNKHLTEIADRELLLREAARNLAIAEERNRMARELHDSISQGMHGIIYSLRSLRSVLENHERGLTILGHLEETADNTLKELRRLVMELSPSSLEAGDLPEALRLHCDLYKRRQQVACELESDYQGGLHPEQEMAVYRIVQESLANAQQHAAASCIKVRLHEDAAGVTLSVSDDGKGFDPQAAAKGTGHGLTNMTTRARQSGGELRIDTAPGKGTTIRVVFPKDPTI
ncbi:MAG TPA: sensor histidine kinase [Firmicutes bacterium]|jgi:signal transduction histidine kinase|nr:sensor histidine kinase [Bacillota bacterium]